MSGMRAYAVYSRERPGFGSHPLRERTNSKFLLTRWLFLLFGFFFWTYAGKLIHQGQALNQIAVPVFSCPFNLDQTLESSCYYLTHLPVLFTRNWGYIICFLATLFLICYTFPLPRNLADILAQMKADGLQLLNKYGRKRFIGISMGLPGPYIRPVGCAPSEERMLVSGFEELSRINLRIELETAWDMEITTEHDAKLQAYAEWKTLQKERKNPSGSLIAVGSVGFGIGAGIIIGGKIVEGQLGVAGEIGHMGINFNGKYSAGQNQGTYEYAAGTDSAVRYMRERLYEFPDSPLSDDSSYQEILSAYHSGDPLAVYAVHKMAWMLGYGLANMIYMLNPDCIRIETDYPNSPEFLQKVEESVQRFVLPEIVETISITCSELRENAILLGGYYLILDRLFEENMFLDRIKQVLS